MPNLPKITLQTASLNPSAFQAAVFTPQKEDMSLLQRSMAMLDERKEKTDQQRAAIKAAISKVNLNQADSEWKQNFINDISKRIDNAAQFGDYSAALEEATVLAGDAISNPELLARAKRNEEYQAWRKDIEDRAISGKIDKRTADRILEQNPYSFYPRINTNTGEVIGGYAWNDTGGINKGPVEVPVNKISLEPLFKEVDSIVAQHIQGGAGITSRNAKGEVVDNYSTDAAFSTKSSSTISYKDEKTLHSVFNELVKMHPELMAYIDQMKKDDFWEIEKLQKQIDSYDANSPTLIADKEKLAELKKSLYTDNGLGIKSNADYLFDRSNTSIKAMSYRNYTGDISISGGRSSSLTPTNTSIDGGDGQLENTNFGGDGKTAETKKPNLNEAHDRFKSFVKGTLNSLGI